MRGCHARYQDFMVFGNQLKPAYYGIYYLHHLKAPRKGKKRSSYCSKFNEVKQWVKSGILMDGVVTIWNIGCLRERAVNVPYYILLMRVHTEVTARYQAQPSAFAGRRPGGVQTSSRVTVSVTLFKTVP